MSAIVACGLMVSCGTGPEPEVAFVDYSFLTHEPDLTLDLVTVEFTDGTNVRRLTEADFAERTTGDRRKWTKEFETSTRGELVTSFWLIRGSDTLSTGELPLELRPDWGWSVWLQRSATDPQIACFACLGATPFGLAPALRRSDADSLWLVLRGNSISNPSIY